MTERDDLADMEAIMSKIDDATLNSRGKVKESVHTLRSKEAISPILSEFVHLSFGAILGVAAFTRGRDRTYPPQSPQG